jgi:uncharacterized membrane protein YbhN (UPF0104 family)
VTDAGEDAGVAGATASTASAERSPTSTRRKRFVRTAFLWVVVAVLAYLALRVLGRIDWADVGAALRQLSGWQIAALVVVVAVRQLLLAVPLALYVPGLGIARAAINDLSANLVATVAPAPSDIVLRLAMFKAWAIDQTRALTGLILQSLSFYVARLAAPVLGFGLLVRAVDEPDPLYATAALTSGLIAVALVVAVAIASRTPGTAAWLGGAGASIVRRIRPRTKGLAEWPARVVEFQRNGAHILGRRSPVVALDYLAVLIVEGVLMVLALRFVGASPAQASAVLIIAAFWCAYPLTGLPLLGLGVLDVAVIALLEETTTTDTDVLVAGLIVWRVCFQLVPLAVGALTLALWRRSLRRAEGAPVTS